MKASRNQINDLVTKRTEAALMQDELSGAVIQSMYDLSHFADE